VADHLPQQGALKVLQGLYESHPQDKLVQGRFLGLLVESGQLAEAGKLQLRLPKILDDNDEETVQRLIEDGMPEKRKEKKTRDVIQETKDGAEIFMPSRKRKRTVRYPKGFDPKNPGAEPDHERWLPKWQRSRFKKIAKKKGIYLKGA
jgi:SRP72 RNA-binding domain